MYVSLRSKVFTTVSSQDKVDYVKAVHNGATDVINYKTHDFAEEIARTTSGKGVNVVIDFIGQNYFKRNIESMSLDGRMVILGLLSGASRHCFSTHQCFLSDNDRTPPIGGELPTGISLLTLLFRRLTVTGSTLRSRSPDYQSELIANFKKDVFDHFTNPSVTDGKPPLDVYIHAVRDVLVLWSGTVTHLHSFLNRCTLGTR